MTEVRETSETGKALFATRDYAIGDTVLQEDRPLAILSRSLSLEESDNPFTAMAQACRQTFDLPDVEAKLLSLYHPHADTTNPAEQELYKSSQSAAGRNHERLHKIIMVACCNSFQGGYLYEQASRINHSCQPNAVVNIQDDDTGALLVQALTTPIASNEEITISYAGLYLYADARARQCILRRDKYFDCTCMRCQAAVDPANTIPCTVCHPRHQSQLDEAAQYDDDEDNPVHYMIWKKDQFVCEYCGRVELAKSSVVTVVHSISDKVLQFLEQYKQQESSSTKGADQEENEDQEEQLESLLQEHLSLASSVLGARHWTTNLLLLLYLDRGLKQYHQKLIFQQTADDDMQLELAEHIDHLQRLTQFVDRLQLGLHSGHVLSDVIVGVARALVSLGDVKSAQYATRWLDHLKGFEPFLSEALLKVVDSLKQAWKRVEEDEPVRKKAKG